MLNARSLATFDGQHLAPPQKWKLHCKARLIGPTVMTLGEKVTLGSFFEWRLKVSTTIGVGIVGYLIYHIARYMGGASDIPRSVDGSWIPATPTKI